MTPMTVKASLVCVIPHTGFHVELASGSHYHATALHAKILKKAMRTLSTNLVATSLFMELEKRFCDLNVGQGINSVE